MPISKDKALYLGVVSLFGFFICGGLATALGRQEWYDFLGVFTIYFFVANLLWSLLVKKLPKNI